MGRIETQQTVGLGNARWDADGYALNGSVSIFGKDGTVTAATGVTGSLFVREFKGGDPVDSYYGEVELDIPPGQSNKNLDTSNKNFSFLLSKKDTLSSWEFSTLADDRAAGGLDVQYTDATGKIVSFNLGLRVKSGSGVTQYDLVGSADLGIIRE